MVGQPRRQGEDVRLEEGDVEGVVLEEVEHEGLKGLAQLLDGGGEQDRGPVCGVDGRGGGDWEGEEGPRGRGLGFEDVARGAGGHFAGVAGAEEGLTLGGG